MIPQESSGKAEPSTDSQQDAQQPQPPAPELFLAPPPTLDFGVSGGTPLTVPPSLGKPSSPPPAASPEASWVLVDKDEDPATPPSAAPAGPMPSAPIETKASKEPPRLAVRPNSERSQAGESWGPPTAPAPEARRAKPGRALKTRRRGDRKVLVLGTVTAVAVSVVTVSVLSRMNGTGHPAAAPTPASASASPTVTFSRTVPPGWSQQAAWSAPISPGTHPALSDGLVALVTADRHLQLRYGSTGAVVWSTPASLPPEVTGSPAISMVAGDPTVLIQGAGQILTWQVSGDGSKATPVAVPDRAQITTTGESPLVSLPDHSSAVLDGAGLTKITLPARTTAMAADKDAVIAGDPKGLWWRIPTGGGAAQKVTPAPPAGADQVTRIAAAGHGVVALVWSMKKGDQLSVASLHDAVTGKVLSQTTAPTGELRAPVWLHSAEGQAAALGPVLFDLAGGTATAYPGFAPLAATGKVIYGQLNQHLAAVTAGPNQPPVQLADGTALPWGITAGGRAVVADRTPSGISLFALNPSQ